MDGLEHQDQVWQRVFARQESAAVRDLRALQLAVMERLSVYRSLSGKLTGKAKERLQQLSDGEQANLAALKGIARLSGQGGEVLTPWNAQKEPAPKLLEKCYHQTRQCLTEYLSRSAEPEFGVVFRQLAHRAERHCALLAEALGLTGSP